MTVWPVKFGDDRILIVFRELAERVFVVLALLIFTLALLPLLRLESVLSNVNSGDPIVNLVFLVIYVIALLLVGLQWKRFIYVATRDKLLLLIVGIALVSVFWSEEPSITVLQGGALVGQTIFGIYFAMRYSLNEQLRLLAWALGIAALLSLLFALALPSYGIVADVRGPSWRGIYQHKNALGVAMCWSAVVFLLLTLKSRRKYRRLVWLSFSGLSAALVVLSNSATALVVLVMLVILLLLYSALRQTYSLIVPLLIITILVGGTVTMVLLSYQNTLLEALGRDPTLTGRTFIWVAALDMAWEHPWLGYGFSAFWQGYEGQGSAYVLNVVRTQAETGLFNVGTAHNGFLDLGLDLGLLGVSVFALGFVFAFLRAVALVRSTKTAEWFLPLMYLTFVLLYSLDERTFLFQPFWVLYVAMVVNVSYRTTTPIQPPKLTQRPVKRPQAKTTFGNL